MQNIHIYGCAHRCERSSPEEGARCLPLRSLPDFLGLDTESLNNTSESPPGGKPWGLLCLPSHREGSRCLWGFLCVLGVLNSAPSTVSSKNSSLLNHLSLPYILSSYVNNLRKIIGGRFSFIYHGTKHAKLFPSWEIFDFFKF